MSKIHSCENEDTDELEGVLHAGKGYEQHHASCTSSRPNEKTSAPRTLMKRMTVRSSAGTWNLAFCSGAIRVITCATEEGEGRR